MLVFQWGSKNPSETEVRAYFLKIYSVNYEALETNTFAECFLAVLAQLSEVFPPVSVVEAPHVAVHVLFHPWVHAMITLVSATQAFWSILVKCDQTLSSAWVPVVCCVASAMCASAADVITPHLNPHPMHVLCSISHVCCNGCNHTPPGPPCVK